MPWPYTARRKRNTRRGQSATPGTAAPGTVVSVTSSTSPAGSAAILFSTPMITSGNAWPSNWTLDGHANNTIIGTSGSTVTVQSPATTLQAAAYVFGATNSIRTSSGGPINPKSGTIT